MCDIPVLEAIVSMEVHLNSDNEIHEDRFLPYDILLSVLFSMLRRNTREQMCTYVETSPKGIVRC